MTLNLLNSYLIVQLNITANFLLKSDFYNQWKTLDSPRIKYGAGLIKSGMTQCVKLLLKHYTAYRQAGVKVGEIRAFAKADVSDSLCQSILPISLRTPGRMRSINSAGVTILNE